MRPTGAAAQGPPLLLALLAACAIAGRCDGRVQQTPTAYANDSPLTERGASAAASAAPTAPLMVVDLRKATLQAKVAVQVCAGLFNRDPGVTGAAYTILGQDDLSWLQEVEGIVNPALTPVPVFLSRCLAGPQATAKGYIRYNASLQKPVMPNLATLAAVLDAVPLEDGDPAIGAATLVFDALKMFANFTALQVRSCFGAVPCILPGSFLTKYTPMSARCPLCCGCARHLRPFRTLSPPGHGVHVGQPRQRNKHHGEDKPRLCEPDQSSIQSSLGGGN